MESNGLLVRPALGMTMLSLLCGAVLAITGMAQAAPQSEAVKDQYVAARLLSSVDSIQPGAPFTVALELDHDGHWHTYWRNAGDSGLATSIRWTLPEGYTAGPIQWPTPQVIEMSGLVTYAYEGKVFLLIEITPPKGVAAGAIAELKADVNWLMCEEICVPGKASLVVSLPVKNAPPGASPWAFDINEAGESLPSTESPWTASATVNEAEATLTLDLKAPDGEAPVERDVYFFAYSPEDVAPGAKQPMEKTASGYRLNLTRPNDAPKLERLAGVLTGNPGWDASPDPTAWAIDIAVVAGESQAAAGVLQPSGKDSTVAKSGEASSASTTGQSVGFTAWAQTLIENFGTPGAFVIAVLGGVILNLMPCVLPVLSIKVLSLVKQAGERPGETLKHGIAYTLGVVLSFLVVAGILLALRAAGEQIGWGFQMQSPVFVYLLIALFFVFALNLFGVFEVGTSMVGIDHQTAKSGGLRGSFGTGALATLAATPCTAPFMGAALGFAVNQSAFMALIIFAGLGFGMALPFLLLAIFPVLMKFVPKPGPWMETFKQFLGFLLMATVAWLVWVFATQTDPNAVLVLMLLLVVLAVAAWIYGKWSSPVKPPSVRRTAIMAALVVGGLSLVGGVVNARQADAFAAQMAASASHAGSDNRASWQPFNPERVAQLRDAGTPVFIDFTATWCLICQANKISTLHTPAITEAFLKHGVVKMEADWTRSDPVITKALNAFGRSGVPLYVLYGPDPQAPPQILPETLTPGIVLEALARMK